METYFDFNPSNCCHSSLHAALGTELTSEYLPNSAIGELFHHGMLIYYSILQMIVSYSYMIAYYVTILLEYILPPPFLTFFRVYFFHMKYQSTPLLNYKITCITMNKWNYLAFILNTCIYRSIRNELHVLHKKIINWIFNVYTSIKLSYSHTKMKIWNFVFHVNRMCGIT